jgi:hypothetical protein
MIPAHFHNFSGTFDFSMLVRWTIPWLVGNKGTLVSAKRSAGPSFRHPGRRYGRSGFFSRVDDRFPGKDMVKKLGCAVCPGGSSVATSWRLFTNDF